MHSLVEDFFVPCFHLLLDVPFVKQPLRESDVVGFVAWGLTFLDSLAYGIASRQEDGVYPYPVGSLEARVIHDLGLREVFAGE